MVKYSKNRMDPITLGESRIRRPSEMPVQKRENPVGRIKIKTEEIVQYLGESLGWIECLDSEWKYGWIPSPKLMKI